MAKSKLQEEIKQSKPFDLPEIEAYLNLVRTNDLLHGNVARFLKDHGVSEPQYNVLRILRGAGPKGLPSLAVADRMVARVPDITRLLDRMADHGLVTRERTATDGRVVIAKLTRKAHGLLKRLDKPLVEFHREQLGHMSQRDLASLSRLLVKARSPK